MQFLGYLSVGIKRNIAGLVIMAIVLEITSVLFVDSSFWRPALVEAAPVTIATNQNNTVSGYNIAGSNVVFIDDQVGYRFYRHGAAPNNGMCVYRKTTDGGQTWGTQIPVDTQTDCIRPTVWYDQWTPGDTGSFIHISTIDTGDDHIFYNRLDTTTDTLLLATATSTTLGSPATYAATINVQSITKSTTGVLYMVTDDAQGSVIVSCGSTCDESTSWTSVGTPPQGNADSWSMLMPLSGGNILLINRSTANQIRSSVWNGGTWSTFTTVDSAAVRNTTYDVGMSATIDTDTGDIYLVYAADNNNFTTANHDIRTAVYSSGSWTNKPDIITNDPNRGILQVAISRDQNNGHIYAIFTARSAIASATSVHTYYYRSTDGMDTWEAEVGPVSTVSGNYYGINSNIMSYDRIYASWYDSVVASRGLYGITIADIGPEVRLGSIGAQKSEVRDDTIDFYLGGAFVLEAIATRTVSSIAFSETGTIHAQDDIANVRLFYDLDTTAPFDCTSEAYSGSESQFGTTLIDGFSGANGVASFTNSPVTVGPGQSVCFYLVMDISSAAGDGDTIVVEVTNPRTDVVVSGSIEVFPFTPVEVAGNTTVVSSNLTQTGYHWRNDDGSETGATSVTAGNENTPLSALPIGEEKRLRLAVANLGSTTSVPTRYRLEYATAAPTCELGSGWSMVGGNNATFDLFPSSNLTNGSDTTNIDVSDGGITDAATTFIISNGGILTTSTSTDLLGVPIDSFVELEFSLMASTTAIEGETYCFRVTRDGVALRAYNQYPSATIAADIDVSSLGEQVATTSIPATNVYSGGAFVVVNGGVTTNVTSITVSEIGTVDAAVGLDNIRLYYDVDTSFPYNCESEIYTGSESQYGSAGSFSGPDGIVTFTDSVAASSTAALCLYIVYDVTSNVSNGQTAKFTIQSPATDVVISGSSSVGPSGQVTLGADTTLVGGVLTMTGYHWRNDDGNEADGTSATGGVENTAVGEFTQNSPIRLRLAISNDGTVASIPTRFRLEYAPKISLCSSATVWTSVDEVNDGWDMFDSSFLTQGADTTNIALSSGGISDPNTTFLTPNQGVRTANSLSATTTLTASEFIELEYSLSSNDFTAFNTTYCFRVTANGTPLPQYDAYPEITTALKRDFKIQRGVVKVIGTSTTLVAGVDYVAPASTSRAFITITNTHQTGAGHDTGATTAQNADDVTAYLENPGNLLTSVTIARPPAALASTRVYWEIIEFVGKPVTDNEIEVRGVGTFSYNTTALTATGTPLSAVADDSKVVVYVTGASNRNTSRNFYASQVTAEWDPVTKSPVFTRGAAGSTVADISYAVVEYTGANWRVQRVEHNYIAPGVIETESILPVNSLARTFIHAQRRLGALTQVQNYGHEVWLSSIGAISFRLEAAASVAITQVSVAWVIENTQTGVGAMSIQRSSGTTSGGTPPLSLSVVLSSPVVALSNTSIAGNSRAVGNNTAYPRPMAGLMMTSTSSYEIYRSNVGSLLTYRAEIIEWPVADLSIRQNYYRFYVPNNEVTPTDPWPPSLLDLGENMPITSADEPLGVGDRVRIRLSLRTNNANMGAGIQDFRIQYGLRATTCSAVSVGNWIDVGAIGAGTIWRGYNATGTTNGVSLGSNPAQTGELLLSVSDVAGSLVHQNPSPPNPYLVPEGDNVEYDWHLEQNGANPESVYCFRVIREDGTPLDGYNFYPQIRTAGFTPLIQTWRWYNEVNNETPTTPLAGENITPIDAALDQEVALRVSVREARNVIGEDIKFKLQFSEDPLFQSVVDLVATSSCDYSSLWCYADGVVTDNQIISTAVLSDSDSCVVTVGDGCGRHNTSAVAATGHVHFPGTTQEYSFYLRQAAARVNAVYYFRLYDVTNDEPLGVSFGSSYPSLVTEGPNLVLTVGGLPAGTSTAGVTTNLETEPDGISFGSMLFNTEYIAAHRLQVETNATDGYQVLKFAYQPLLSSNGAQIQPVSGTNAAPTSWSAGCLITALSCVGYHTTDAILRGGSTRFAPTDTYAALAITPVEIMYSSIPTMDTHDIVYRIVVSELQPAGLYETEIVYIAVPAY